MRILWADLHNHNEVGYGRGSLERSYQLASNLLDVYAFTPHGWWPDPPGDDPKVRDYHLNAFEAVEQAFPAVCAAANSAYQPGSFVSFVGFEWHSSAWGDYHVLFPGDAGAVRRASHAGELQEFARTVGALLIPHHCAYRAGWRGTNWSCWREDVSPLAEAFSEHGNSLEEDSHFAMTGHSMGGALESQTILAQLRSGKRLGLTAGTDNHYGHPGSYGEGVTGIWAEEATRHGVFEALRARRTFAATGDRIELQFRSGQAMMGERLEPSAPRRFDIDIAPLAPVEFVQVIRNGAPAAGWAPAPPAGASGSGRRLVRLEWGWGLLGAASIYRWNIHISIAGGSLMRIIPCLGGGPASTVLLNQVHHVTPQSARVESFTSRANPRATNAVVLDLLGDESARLALQVEAASNGDSGGFHAELPVAEIQNVGASFAISKRFSAPKLKVGRAHAAADVRCRLAWTDPSPGEKDWYMLKVQQRNGQCAWSSPIWFEEDGE